LIFILALIGVPIAYLVVLIGMLFRRDPRGIVVSLLFGAIAATTGLWAIFQSRSSTAGIAVLGIPMMAAIGGFLGLAFGRFRTSTNPTYRIGAWVGLAGVLLLVSYNISQGMQTKAKNRGTDAKQTEFSAEVARDREMIASALAANPGRESTWLDSSIRTRMNDRAFLLAALPNHSVSPDILDSLANSPDWGIALESVRNPNARAETLERVYRTKSYPDYFFQPLAAHKNTPPKVLLELYHRPQTITGLDIWFAGNPSTPREILDKISRTSTDRSVIGVLLENPSLDCALLGQVGVNLLRVQHRDADDPNVVRVSSLLPTVCPQKTAPSP
jgi:hypothetical protein